MARLEDADDDEVAGASTTTLSSAELYRKLVDLSPQLVIPEELIPTLSSAEVREQAGVTFPDLAQVSAHDAIHTLVDHTKRIVRQMRALTDTAAWTSLSIEQLGSILLPVLNHRGEEPWCSIALTQDIDGMFLLLSRYSIDIRSTQPCGPATPISSSP